MDLEDTICFLLFIAFILLVCGLFCYKYYGIGYERGQTDGLHGKWKYELKAVLVAEKIR